MSDGVIGRVFTNPTEYRIERPVKTGEKFFNPDGTVVVIGENPRGNLYVAVPAGSPEILVCLDGLCLK